jgi:SOS-response transcriptional repressor LexA
VFTIGVNMDEAPDDAVCSVRLVGRIAAGVPIDAVQDIETICVPRFLLGRVRPERIYALRVKGDSMIDEHICDGDIALIESRNDARDGEIVVALIDRARATLKRLFRSGMKWSCDPQMPNFNRCEFMPRGWKFRAFSAA